MKRALGFALLLLASCEHRNDKGFVTASASILGPVAVAGDDQKVLQDSLVALDGSKSSPAGAITYLWEQIGGTPVTLSDPTVDQPTFDAPPLVAPATEEELTFRLTVTDSNGTDSDTVAITVKTVIVSMPDAWFAGYNTTGSLTATASGGSGPYVFTWTGIDNGWFTWTAGSATVDYATPDIVTLQPEFDIWKPQYYYAVGVALLKSTALGRLQLKVRVEDADGADDEDIVNFSVGPFTANVMGNCVPIGEPVFLNGGSWTLLPDTTNDQVVNWTWTGTRPNDTPISFYEQDRAALDDTLQRFVYFVPDLPGTYQIFVTQTAASGPNVVQAFIIVAGSYVGTGDLLGKLPDSVSGECGSCHRGAFSWLDDLATPFSQTGHATAFSRLLDPSHPLYAAAQAKGRWQDAFDFGSDIDLRTTGFSMIADTANSGWAEHAQSEKYDFKGTTWEELKRRYPGTASRSNVQCEACHGPGSLHVGDSNGISKGYDSMLCGRCHVDELQELLESDEHDDDVDPEPGNDPECNGCHTAQGFAVEMKAQLGADPYALSAYVNPARPVLPASQQRNVNCISCHDPHRKTANRPANLGNDPQLRAYGRVRFANGAVADAGPAALCVICHQTRVDARDGSADFNARRKFHWVTNNAEMLSGTNGMHFPGWTYSSSPHGIPDRFIAPGKTENRHCLSCHFDGKPAPGMPGYGKIGGHSLDASKGYASWYNTGACMQCHVISADFQVMARGDYDGNGTVDTVQQEVNGLADKLWSVIDGEIDSLVPGGGLGWDMFKIAYWNGPKFTFPGPGVLKAESGFDWQVDLDDEKREKWTTLYKAAYNLWFVEDDDSDGVHNTGYAVNLLQSSYYALTGTEAGERFLPY